jgi:hypothetical protein
MTTDPDPRWNFKSHAASLFAILAWTWLLFFLPDFSNVGFGFGESLALAASLLIFAGLWIVVSALVFWPSPSANRSAVCWWLAADAAFVLAFVLVVTNVGLLVRLRLNEPWLAERVAQIHRGDAGSREPGAVGLFIVDRVDEHDGAVYFFTSGYGFMDSAGVAFIPEGVQAHGRICRIRHLFGSWYTFWWKF